MNMSINPLSFWQDLMTQGAKNFATMCSMNPLLANNKVTQEPFAFSPFMMFQPQALPNAMQQAMSFWQNAWQGMALPAKTAAAHETPAGAWPFFGAHEAASLKPKVTVMTVELGEMGPLLKQANEFIGQWQNMWLQNMGKQG